MGVLSACYVFVQCACLVPEEVRRGFWLPWDWNNRQLCHVGARKPNVSPQEEQPVLLTISPASTLDYKFTKSRNITRYCTESKCDVVEVVWTLELDW